MTTDRRNGAHRQVRQLARILLSCTLVVATARAAGPLDSQTEAALLAEDWTRVAASLDTAQNDSLSAVARLIKGHAYLALNRNNESACLFLSTAEKYDLDAWHAWTSEFLEAHPASTSARYLKGDALARLGQYESASRLLEAALKEVPSNALILNAIGVIQARRGELRTARVFFQEAARQREASALADAHANIGALLIQQKEGPKGALSALNSAIDDSPNFALALHDRGCIHLVAHEFAAAKRDFEKAGNAASCGRLSALLAQNMLTAQAYWAGLSEQELLTRLSDDETGTTIRATAIPQPELFKSTMADFNKWTATLSQGDFNRFVGKFGALHQASPALADRLNTAVNKIVSNNPKMAQVYTAQRSEVQAWSGPGGGARYFSALSAVALTELGGLGGAALTKTPAGLKIGRVGGAVTGQAVKVAVDGISDRSFAAATALKPVSATALSGGVDASFDQARWDEGDWPFVAYYGLFYP